MFDLEYYENKYNQRLSESMELSEADIRATFRAEDFSIRNLRTMIFQEACEGNLKENAETAFGNLLRGGIQALALDYFNYSAGSTIYQDLVQYVRTDKYAEFYGPMYGVELPKEVNREGRYAESTLHGTDSMIVNKKFGRLYKFEEELWLHDRTGQVKAKSQQIGEGMRILKELYFSARLCGVAMRFPEDIYIEAPKVVAQIYKDDLFGTVGGQKFGNRPEANEVLLTQQSLEGAYLNMLQSRDPHQKRIMVNVNTLVVSASDTFNAAKLIHSTLQPSVPAVSNQGAGSSPFFTGGNTGWINTINPLVGMFKLKVGRYLPLKHWFIGEAKKGIIEQEEAPMSIVQENPTSGESFSRDVYVFKSKARWEMDWIEGSPVFWYKGYNPAP